MSEEYDGPAYEEVTDVPAQRLDALVNAAQALDGVKDMAARGILLCAMEDVAATLKPKRGKVTTLAAVRL